MCPCTANSGKTTDEFIKKVDKAFPFPLSFLVLPVVLHKDTRTALPHSTVTSLLSWVQDHRAQLVDFAVRVQRLQAITEEAIIFGAAHQVFAFDDIGNLLIGEKRLAPTERRTELFTAEARECINRAGFIGRWFAAGGTTATIYSAWGIAP